MTRTQRNAALLLAACANQETYKQTTWTMPGFVRAERRLAYSVVSVIRRVRGFAWREKYAEAEAMIRNGEIT